MKTLISFTGGGWGGRKGRVKETMPPAKSREERDKLRKAAKGGRLPRRFVSDFGRGARLISQVPGRTGWYPLMLTHFYNPTAGEPFPIF